MSLLKPRSALPEESPRPLGHPAPEAALVDEGRHERLLRPRVQHPRQRPHADLAADLRRPDPVARRARHGAARARHRDAGRQHLLHRPRPPAGPPGEPARRHGAALRAERPAHVHRRLRHHAADLPGHQGSRSGLAGRAGLGVRHRRHRPHRGVHRTVHPPDHAAGRDARDARGHLADLHLDASGRADLGGRVDRPAGAGHHPRRLLHQHPAPRRYPDRARGPARRHGHRVDRWVHVGSRRLRRRAGDRHRGSDPARRDAGQRAGPADARSSPPPSRSASTTSPRR